MENLIIDTDFGFDCDDAGALAVANTLKNKGKLEILAVTHSVNKKIGCDAIKLINDYYGNSDIPVGVAERYAIRVDRFYEEFYAKFHYAEGFPGWGEKPTFYKILNGLNLEKYKNIVYRSAKEVIIETLEKSEDKSVTLLCIGQANNIADVLGENAALLYQKVKHVVIMCGNFNDYDYEYRLGDMYWKGEFNVILDVKSMQKLFAEKDLPVYVLDFNQGFDVLSGEGLATQNDNPVRNAYIAHKVGESLNMPSWDIMALMFASGEFNDMFSLGKNGSISVDDNGKTTFASGKGEHRLIYRKSEQKVFAGCINELLCDKQTND